MRISFNASHEENKMIEVKPGMSLVGEIITDEQSVLDFFVKKPISEILHFGKQ